MTLRTTAPVYKRIDTIDITRPRIVRLDNNIPLYILKAGTQDVIKITLLFNAGSIYQQAPLVAFAANNLLTEGTQHYTATQISELNDFYGSHIACTTDKDSATVTLLVLRKYVHNIMPLLEEVIKQPTYPEQELQTFVGRHVQQFLVEQTKGRNIAHKQFVGALFGNNHPYGYELQQSDFEKLTTVQLSEFHQAYYQPDNCKIVVSGNVQDEDVALINKHLGNNWPAKNQFAIPPYHFSEAKEFKHHITKPEAVQASVRIGKQVCSKLHPDYTGLTIVNTLLGGYFGSRLMQNIREDKGYTYGINSLLVSLRHAGYFAIVTDVGKDVAGATLREIYKEIERLQQELVSEQELDLVRTNLLSEMLRSFDGPFAQAESLIALLEYEQDANYYEQYVEGVKSINAREIQRLSQQYLDIHRIYEVVVG